MCDNYNLLPLSKYQVLVKAETGGFISEIDALEVGWAAVDIGAGRRKKEDSIDHAAGFVFSKKIGDRVDRGDTIVTIHAGDKGKAESATERLKRAVLISKNTVAPPQMIRYYVDKNGSSPV